MNRPGKKQMLSIWKCYWALSLSRGEHLLLTSTWFIANIPSWPLSYLDANALCILCNKAGASRGKDLTFRWKLFFRQEACGSRAPLSGGKSWDWKGWWLVRCGDGLRPGWPTRFAGLREWLPGTGCCVGGGQAVWVKQVAKGWMAGLRAREVPLTLLLLTGPLRFLTLEEAIPFATQSELVSSSATSTLLMHLHQLLF